MQYLECGCNAYADHHYPAGAWVVAVRHGSGDGRSFGTADVWQAPTCGWRNDDPTTHHIVCASEAEAHKIAAAEDAYYDGSDYA
jgi:hypothetical protein